MDVSAHLLPCFSGPKDADDGYLRNVLTRRTGDGSENRVEIGWHGLIMVDAIEAEAEGVHELREACTRGQVKREE